MLPLEESPRWLPLIKRHHADNSNQVVFANNPISGLLMLIGLFLADIFVGLVTIYTSAIAVLVAAYSGQEKALVQVQDSSLISSCWDVH